MPLSKITTLIDKQDTNEIVRDQIAAILTVEIDKQKDLAASVGKNPIDWDIDVYIERLRPFEAMSDENGEEIGEKPLVNVSFDNDVFDTKGSDNIGNQKAKGVFYLDCYGHKNSYIGADGLKKHGDELTSKESDHIARIIRNIIMSNVWTYLGLGGSNHNDTGDQIVFRRYILRREKFIPSDREGRFFENIIATRLTLEVDYREYSPQFEGVDLELLINACEIGESGLITFSQNFDLTE